MRQLDGKVAIVTGGSRGLGRAISLLYAQHGASIVVADVLPREAAETVSAISATGGEARFIEVNVAKESAVEQLVCETETHYGRLDIMTANAGILGRGSFKSVGDVSDQELREIMDVNFYGVYYCFKHAIPAILRAGGGAMTATSSLAAHRGFRTLPAYCASKGAVVALVRSLAADLAPAIRVNAVSAGSMTTDIAAGLDVPAAHVAGTDAEPNGLASSGAVRTRADPEEVARAHLFLASSESSFITGQALLVDGGRSILPA